VATSAPSETTGRKSRSERAANGNPSVKSTKVKRHVKFPLVLDMGDHTVPSKRSGNYLERLARLFAVVVHVGESVHQGHYYCYVQNMDNRKEWRKIDDNGD